MNDVTNGRKIVNWTLGSTVALLVGVVTIWQFAWPRWGWSTIDDHKADMAEIVAKHNADMANISTTIQIFRDEWRCDRFNKELREQYVLSETQSGSTKRATDYRIDNLIMLMNSSKCDRFQRY